MQIANAETVLGNFEAPAQPQQHGGWTRTFAKRDGKFYVDASRAQGDSESFEVRYTFGVYPLQQYLVAADGGRYQVVDLAHDSRAAADGGQRWFAPAGAAQSTSSALPWHSRDANWNGMCAACHSTGLRKGYDVAHDRFETTWAELNVACEACHGRGSRHVEWAELERAGHGSASGLGNKGFETRLRGASSTRWRFENAQSIASAPGASGAEIADTNAEVNRCLPCHARRQELTREPSASGPVLDDYAPSLLDPGLYHADGQVEDEDFEYGSFAQSRMYLAGVTCSNCHDPHTAKLRAQGNALCAQCHAPARFDQPAHHHHAPDSTGAQCVSCHMPSKTYMGVHVRRDHAIRVPRPDLSVELGVPNVCEQCHANERAAWAARALTKWGVQSSERETAYARAIVAGRSLRSDANLQLARVAVRTDLAPIRRATALSLLRGPLVGDAQSALQQSVRDSDDLVRYGAARALDALADGERVPLGVSLLTDRARAVRVEAARALADTPPDVLTAQQREQLMAALREWVAARLSTGERPEAHVDLAQLYTRLRRVQDAERALEHALVLDSQSLPARVNLADLKRMTGRDAEAETLLRETVELRPTASVAWHALGLALVRRGQRTEATDALGRAHALAPAEPDYAYAFGLALREAGRSSEAQSVVHRALVVTPDSAELIALLRLVESERKPAKSRR